MEQVLVEYGYEYTARDGRQVSIKPDETFILVSKTSDHWWHVRRDYKTKPFYIPAEYVRKLPSLTLHAPDHGHNSNIKLDLSHERVMCDMSAAQSEVVLTRDQAFSADNMKRDTLQFSTFGYSENTQDVTSHEPIKSVMEPRTSNESVDLSFHWKSHGPLSSLAFSSGLPGGLCDVPHHTPQPPVPRNATKGILLSHSIVRDQSLRLENLPGQEKTFGHVPQSCNISEAESVVQIPTVDVPGTNCPTSQASTDLSALQVKATTGLANPTDSASKGQVENECEHTAIYVNVARRRRNTSESPPPSASPSSCSDYRDPQGWEVHTDEDSGQEYYYHPFTGHTTWDNPLLYPFMEPEAPSEEPCSPSPSLSPTLSPTLSPSTASPGAWASDWEKLLDETSGRAYFYNPSTKETSWERPEQLRPPYPSPMEPTTRHWIREEGPPPLPEEDYPEEEYHSTADQSDLQEDEAHTGSLSPLAFPIDYTHSHVTRAVIPRASLDRNSPAGWTLSVESDGTWVFTSDHSQEQWIKSLDDQGQTYYYLRDGSKSQWNLPEAPVVPGHSKVGNGVETDLQLNRRHTMAPGLLNSTVEDGGVIPTHRRNASDYGSEGSSAGNSPETQHHADGFRYWRCPYYLTSKWLRYNVQNLEKAGILNKTKVSDNGKRVRKNWAQSWTVLHGGVLTFHKDPKSTTGTSNKTNQIVPEVTVELQGATIGWASKDKSSKKNVLELKSKNSEFLIQYDTESIITDWHKVLSDTIRNLEYQEHQSDEEDVEVGDRLSSTDREDRPSASLEKKRVSRPSVNSAGETDQKKVRTKLMKFLMKRPTLQSVKERGYIRDNIFGCHLATLCALEKSTVPAFVENCIKAVERRGLDIDGIYRVSGNLAVIQKLRFKADHEELDLEDGQWEDIHVITGALKLFFRELPEPLFPFSHFSSFINAIRTSDYNLKVSFMRDLVRSLPPANHDTMEVLFGHLHKVIELGEENRMTVQNVAIVFGPTLLRPETESANIAMHMVFQNQIVELVLNEYEHIFHSS